MTRRKLTSDEVDLWRKVTENTHRLHPEMQHKDPLPKPKPIKSPRSRLVEFNIGSKAAPKVKKHDLMPALADRLARAPVNMDKRAFTKLRRGKLKPEGKIDLHGMTVDQAHPALIGFILRAHGEGKRLVLVVTGKGKNKQDDGPMPIRRGILKHQVPQWLSMPPVGSSVLQVSEAHLRHGGSGAYYVYLRRRGR